MDDDFAAMKIEDLRFYELKTFNYRYLFAKNSFADEARLLSAYYSSLFVVPTCGDDVRESDYH